MDLDSKLGCQSEAIIDKHELALEHMGGIRVRSGGARGNVFLV
jgi:hypothetical protein